jgi:hypothetical protein
MINNLFFLLISLIFEISYTRFISGSELHRPSVADISQERTLQYNSKQNIKINPLAHQKTPQKKAIENRQFISNWQIDSKKRGLGGITMDGYNLYNKLEHSGEMKQMILMLAEAGISGPSVKKLVIKYCNNNAKNGEMSPSLNIFEDFISSRIDNVSKNESKRSSSEDMKERERLSLEDIKADFNHDIDTYNKDKESELSEEKEFLDLYGE